MTDILTRRWLLACLLALLSPLSNARDTPKGPVVLTISGAIEHGQPDRAVLFDDAMLQRFKQHRLTVQTPWYPQPQTFEGPLLRDVLANAGVRGTQLSLRALNDYVTTIPVADSQRYNVILARKRNGKLMTVRDKGPLFVMYPFD
ncbi:MAG TPA: molybdopterin-dependent oxidoreductase, partial [Chitinolyticbacter sp.]|nr:molybdopterin-dependent oxidoreductase [Chitinolyticbacter sp.]